MRKHLPLFAFILAGAPLAPASAGTKALFEVKTATAAVRKTSANVLSNATPAEVQAKRAAEQTDRKALKAYESCPSRPRKAAHALEGAARKLSDYRDALAELTVSGDAFATLAAFAETAFADVEALLAAQGICDDGLTLTQTDDLDYAIDPAPFVNFAPGWGTLFSSAHGTFGDFAPDSAAPDHVHSRTYHGVVISGVVKNPFGAAPGADLGGAKPLPPGSFWSVPANAIHTTACDSGAQTNCLFYFHSRGAFDFDTDVSGGEPMDDAAQEIAADEIAAALARPEAVVSPFARMFTVWGDRTIGAHGTIGEFIPGGASPSHSHSYTYHGVVLSGTMLNPFAGEPLEDAQPLQTGDYWFVPAGVEHVTACVSAEPCTFYFHSEGLFDFLLPDD